MTTIGSNLIFIEEKLIQIIENLRIYLQETTEKSDDYVKVHNATCIYTTMLLFSVSGHRDTRDPFCFRKFINTDLGALIIDDKAVTEKHRYRLAAIPEIALNQIKEYETHLDWLMSHLIIDKNNHELVAAIHMTKNTEIPIKDQILPFFFLLERKKGVLKTISITKSVLYEQIGKLWIFPFNFGRHGISSRLRIHDNYLTNNGLTIEQIKAQLNHMDGQDHPFGKNAIISPIEFRKTFSRALQSLAENDHWQIIKSRRSFKRIPESTKSKWKHEKALLGPFAREADRNKRKNDDEAIASKIAHKYTVEEIVKDPNLLEEGREQIIKESGNNSDRIKYRLLCYWKELITRKRSNPEIILPRKFTPLEQEASPFSYDTLCDFRRSCQTRKRFIEYLEKRGKDNSSISDQNGQELYYRRIAEIILSAALFDAVCNKRTLELLSKSALKLTKEADLIYLDIYETNKLKEKILIWRWLPQPLSVSLTLGLDKINTNRITKSNQIQRTRSSLSALLTEIGIHDVNHNNAFKIVNEIAKAFWLYHLPPVLYKSTIGNELRPRPLPESCIIRLIRNRRLKTSSSDTRKDKSKIVANNFINYGQHIKDNAHKIKYAKQFKKDFGTDIKNTERVIGTNKSADNERIDYIKELMQNRLSNQHTYPSISVAIGSWCLKLCEKGTDLSGKVKFTTIRKYTRMLNHSILLLGAKEQFFYNEPEFYEEIYQIALNSGNHNDKSTLANNIKDFHRFLVTCDVAPICQLDWLTDQARSEKTTSKIDANFFTIDEYHQALFLLDRLSDTKQCSMRDAKLLCGVLIIGYRFGLRIGEIFGLQHRNIIQQNDFGFIVIEIRNTFLGSTKTDAGVRYAPQIEKLEPYEKDIIRSISTTDISKYGVNDALIFNELHHPKRSINIFKYSQILQKAIKQVTGDRNSHFHSVLRHGFISKTLPIAIPHNDIVICKTLRSIIGNDILDPVELRKLLTGNTAQTGLLLKAISIMVGHAHLSTTINNYTHSLDFLIYAYASSNNLWHELAFKNVDAIISYSSFTPKQTIKKRRQRASFDKKNLYHTCQLNNDKTNIPSSDIESLATTENEILDINADHYDYKISLYDIDQVLRYFCEKNEFHLIDSEKDLFIHRDVTQKILSTFNRTKSEINYIGYRTRTEISTLPEQYIDEENNKESAGIYRSLLEINNRINNFSANEIIMLKQCLEAWKKGYYSNSRYRPIIFTTPDQAIDYIDGLKLIGINSNCLHIESRFENCEWFSIQSPHTLSPKSPKQLSLINNNQSISYDIHNFSAVKEMPIPNNIGVNNRVNRISISLAKSAKHNLSVQKRLSRVLFLLAILFDQ